MPKTSQKHTRQSEEVVRTVSTHSKISWEMQYQQNERNFEIENGILESFIFHDNFTTIFLHGNAQRF
jgi:hypothetical protein